MHRPPNFNPEAAGDYLSDWPPGRTVIEQFIFLAPLLTVSKCNAGSLSIAAETSVPSSSHGEPAASSRDAVSSWDAPRSCIWSPCTQPYWGDLGREQDARGKGKLEVICKLLYSSLFPSNTCFSCLLSLPQAYYYNARTRESSWSKPDGVKIIQQSELNPLLVAGSAGPGPSAGVTVAASSSSVNTTASTAAAASSTQAPSTTSSRTLTSSPDSNTPSPAVTIAGKHTVLYQPYTLGSGDWRNILASVMSWVDRRLILLGRFFNGLSDRERGKNRFF